MTRLQSVGLTFLFLFGLGADASAQSTPVIDTLRVSATAGVAAANVWYETLGDHSVRAPSSLEWAAMVDRRLSAKWALRADTAGVSWSVGPRIEYTHSGQPLRLPAGQFVERRVTFQVVKSLRDRRGFYSLGESHAGFGVYWNGVRTDNLSKNTRPGASVGWDLLIPASKRSRVVLGIDLDAVERGASPVDLPYLLIAMSFRVGARFGF